MGNFPYLIAGRACLPTISDIKHFKIFMQWARPATKNATLLTPTSCFNYYVLMNLPRCVLAAAPLIITLPHAK